MASLTSKQIYDLNNSMVAAQNVYLGTVLDSLMTSASMVVSGSLVTGVEKITSGTFTPSGPSTAVASGLSTVSSVVVALGGQPKTNHMWTSASVSGTTLWFTCWQPTNASTVTPVISTGSASGHFAALYWVAKGLA